VSHAFNHQALSIGAIESLGIPIDRDALIADFEEIGYPWVA
jgi:hypothetical protein